MKLELKRQDFLKAWQTAEKIAVSKAIPDIVNSIRIKADFDGQVTLEATDLKTSVKCKAQGVAVIEPGRAMLPVVILGGMLKKLKCDTLTIEVNGTKGMLFAEGNKTRFTVVPVENFPNIPESSGAEMKCEIQSSSLAAVIAEGSTASSQPQDFPKYIGACLMSIDDEKLKVASTDGKRLAISESLCTVHMKEEILLPLQAFRELSKQLASCNDENVRIIADDSTVWFALDEVEFSIRRIDANFPDYHRILNSNIETELHISCDELISVIERVDIVAKTTIPHIMVIDMNPNGRLRVYARAPEGVAGEFLEADITGSPMQIGFNAGYFLDGLRALGSGDIKIEFSGSEEQTRMKRNDSSNFLYMLMPSRLSSQDILDDELNDADSYSDNNPEEHYDMPEPEGEQDF